MRAAPLALFCAFSGLVSVWGAFQGWKYGASGICRGCAPVEFNNVDSDLQQYPIVHRGRTSTGNSVAICTIVKNQNEYLREWVEHNLALGVETIYIYDHDSVETPLVELWDYAVEGKVQYRSFTHYKFPHDDIIGENDTVRFIGAQLYVHQDCLDTYGHLHDWMGFIDVDEFVVLMNEASSMSLPQFLELYSDHSALGLNWRVLGSGGHVKKPKAGVRASYTHCLPKTDPYSRYIKIFVQPKWTKRAFTHRGDFTGPPMVTDNWKRLIFGTKAKDVTEKYHGDRITLYHYYTKSQEEAYAKIQFAQELIKQGRWWPTGGLNVSTAFVDNINKKADANSERCLDALKYVPAPHEASSGGGEHESGTKKIKRGKEDTPKDAES